jgi:hypothetical protein
MLIAKPGRQVPGRISRRVRLVLAGSLGLSLLASCGTAGRHPPVPPPVSFPVSLPAPAPVPAPVSAWQRVLDQIGPDGSVSEATALAAFVLAVGPLPGVPQPPGPVQTIADGSGAVRWLLGYYAQLTGAQQSAVRRLLFAPALSARGSGAHPAVLVAAAFTGPLPGTAQDVALEQAAVQQISSRLHVQLTIPVQVWENQTEQTANGKPALMYTTCTDATGGFTGPAPAAKCMISINPSAHQLPGGDGGSYFKAVMIHEVFHCFEAQLAGTIGRNTSAANAESWLIEGAADWVASDIVADDPEARAQWQNYLSSPARPLFSRSYDAIGFFGHLYPGGGVSPWAVLPAMLRAGSNTAAYDAATSRASAGLLDSEASVFFANPALGSAWYQHGAQAAPAGTAAQSVVAWARSPVQQAAVAAGPWVSYHAAPYTDQVLALHLSAPVTQFSLVYGHARLHAAHGAYEAVNPSLTLCTAADGRCQGCPAASSLAAFGTAGDLALTGGPDGTLLRVRGISLQQFCSQQVSAPQASCGNLPAIGPQVIAHFARFTGFTELLCYYSADHVEVGFILILTYSTPAAARAAYDKGDHSAPTQPGFAVPVHVIFSCLGGDPDICSRKYDAFTGIRLEEMAVISTEHVTPMPSLAQTNMWMHQLLAAT